MQDKNNVESILLKYKTQPVGWRYREFIVKRELVEDFVMEILTEGFYISQIGWWEYCKTLDTKNQLGLSGPKSIYYDGWFSEICFTDDFPHKINLTGNIMEKNKIIMDHIKNIKLFENITFENTETLTPSFIIDVPADWHNIIKNYMDKIKITEIREIMSI
jgi:hypothetical protein